MFGAMINSVWYGLALIYRVVSKRFSRLVAYLYLIKNGVNPNIKHVSTKQGKVVYTDGNKYYVYKKQNRLQDLVSDIEVALQPIRVIGRRVLVYPSIQVGVSVESEKIFQVVDAYSRSTEELNLGALFERLRSQYHWCNTNKLMFDYILDRYPSSTRISIGLCHGDLTRNNSAKGSDGKFTIIDWDDYFYYTNSYDKIYYLLLEYLEIRQAANYEGAYKFLHVEGESLKVQLAIENLESICKENYSELEYLLFLLMFFLQSSRIDLKAGSQWKKVKYIE